MNRKINCLLIDDDEDDYEIFKIALKEVDNTIAIEYINTVEDALDKLKYNTILKPHFIFIDLNMPKLNGFQCLEAIRKMTGFKDTPVYIYSTSSDPKTIRQTKMMGANDFIVKPSNLESLIQILSRLFQ